MTASLDEESAAPALATDGPVLVFGGCYSNLEATQEVLQRATGLGIPPARTICTGDVVAYGADAAAAVDLIRRSGVHVVMGNCEEALGFDAEDCGCGFAAGSACDVLSVAWYAHARRQISAADKAWMRELPRRIDIVVDGRRLAVVHGGVQSINAFLFASTDATTLGREISLSGCDGVIAGHCGLPFSRIVAGRLWHNSGAIGMPANDGTPHVWYSLLTPGPDGLAIEHQAISYDHATAASKMRRAGLPEGYAGALETGLWPSCDILPARELAQRGRPIAPHRLLWAQAGN
ncbi:metallophosphoesterase family protein [Desertibaculum subflavum]|uniref:metallophosphoesterase family protein n=1 Tax=Desertibaculum subflavum TaxID=2268458 RepID=UPI000E670BE4